MPLKHESPVKIGVEIECGVPTKSKAGNPVGYGDNHLPTLRGWGRGCDGDGVEWRFGGPANSLQAAFDLLDHLKEEYFSWAGVTAFGGSGTHIHLGLQEHFRKLHKSEIPAARLYYSYFVSRERGFYDKFLSNMRKQNSFSRSLFSDNKVHTPTLGDNYLVPRTNIIATTPLFRIHNHFVTGPAYNETAPWIPTGLCASTLCYMRKMLPTFEFRHFEGTDCTDAVKGYICLLLNMLQRADVAVTKLIALGEIGCIKSDSEDPGLIVHPVKFTTEDLINEVKETDFFSDELVSWMKETVKHAGKPIPFEYDEDYLTAEARRYKTTGAARSASVRAS